MNTKRHNSRVLVVLALLALLFTAQQATSQNTTIETIPAGLQFTADGVPMTAPQTLPWYQEVHELGADSLQLGSTGVRYRWISWNNGQPRIHIVSPESETTYVATFVTQFELSVASVPAGGGTTSPTGSVFHDSGSVVSISATPNAGYVFSGWAGDASGTSNPLLIAMNGPRTVTALFTPIYQVTVTSSPPGRSIVVDGSTIVAPQTFNWISGSSHTISSDSIQNGTAETRYVWTSWSSGGPRSYTVVPASDTVLTANFQTQYVLTMVSGTGGSVTPASDWYASGTPVVITATPDPGYSFTTWTGTGTGSYTGTLNPSTATVNSPMTETATFTLIPYQVEVGTVPSGLTVTVDGVNFTSPSTFSFVPGSIHTIAVPTPQAGPAGVRYAWDSWSDGGAASHAVTITGDSTLTATFVTQYQLTVSSNPVSGGSTVPAGANFVDSGSTVNVTATPALNFEFTDWGGDASGTDNPLAVTMSAPKSILANFSGTVDITVGSNPPGRSFSVDGVVYNSTQLFTWPSGSSHTIATSSLESGGPGIQYVWTDWSDGGAVSHTIAPVTDQSFVANFQAQYLLTVSSNPPAGGTTTPSGPSYQNSDAEVSILATPNSGYRFSGWTGDVAGTLNPVDVLMDGPKTVTAGFVQTVQTTVTTTPVGLSIVVDGTTYTSPQSFTWDAGSSHTISTTATQNGATGVRYLWSNWSDAGAISHTVTPSTNTSYTATFQTQYFLTMTAGRGGTVLPASNWYNSGDVPAISATPNPAYAFTGWTGTGSGSYTGMTNPSTVTMNGPVSEVASFSQFPVTVQIISTPAGRSFFVDGVQYTSPQSFAWSSGTTHTLNTDSIQNGTTGTRYAYTSWSDGGALSHSIVPLSDSVITVDFDVQYFLTMAANPGGTVSPASNWHVAGDVVSISAIPSSGYSFNRWSGTGSGSTSGTSNPANITMNGPISETASFTQNPFQLTIGTNPQGRSFRYDGVTYTTTQTFTVAPGLTHTIAIITNPQSGGVGKQYSWTSWSDSGEISHTILPVSDTTIVANFTTQFFVTTTAGAGGSVAPASSWQDSASTVLLSATPDAQYAFSAWTGTGTGAYSGTSNPVSVLIRGAITEAASFVQTPPSVTVRTDPPGLTYSIDGVQYSTEQTFVFSSGSLHTFATTSPQNQTASSRLVWNNWSDGGSMSHTFTALRDSVVIANFKRQFFLTTSAGVGGTVSPSSNWFDSASVVNVSATPNAAYTFTGWVGSGNGSYTGPTNPASVTMYDALSETANFSQFPVQVTVRSTPAGRSFRVDGVTYTSTQVFTWTSGSMHTIDGDSIQSGSTGLRYAFASWSDGGSLSHVITPVADGTYTIDFGIQYLLTMIANAGGTVTPASDWYDAGTQVTITAIPNSDFSFNRWSATGSGSYAGTNNPALVTMNAPITETASFIQNPVQLTIGTNPPGRQFRYDGTVYTTSQTFTIIPGSAHTISIIANPQGVGGGKQYRYDSWSDSGDISHVINPTTDSLFTANFVTQFQVTTAAGTGGTVTPSTAYYDSGASVELTGVPNTAYRFSSWTGSGAGSYSGTLNPVSVAVRNPITETASFSQYTIQAKVRSAIAGRTFSVDGILYTDSTLLTWTAGTNHSLTTTTPQVQDAGTRWAFGSWSDGGSMSHTVAPLSDTTFTISFNPQYFLTMTAGTGGSVLPANGWHDGGSIVPITATPTGGYVFSSWTGTGTGSYSGPDNPASVTMDSPITEVAAFVQFPVRVLLTTLPAGGTITVDGITYATPETLTWSSGTTHTVSADSIQGDVPSRSIWTGWKDGGSRTRTVSTIKDTVFTATFRTQYYLTMNTATGGSGSPASSWHDSAAVVQISATPNTGFNFAGWIGSGSGSYTGPSNPASVTMLEPVNETPSFTQGSISVTIRSNPPNRTFVVDGTTYTNLQVFTWSAGSLHPVSTDSIQPGTAGTRYVWSNWNDGGGRSHDVSPRQDTTIIVNFGTQYLLTMNANAGGTVDPITSWYPGGTIVPITAIPNNGYTFSRWSGIGNGGYSGTTNPVNVTVNGPITETASFSQNLVQITIMTNPPGRSFRVDGTTYTITQTFSFTPGSTHQLLTTTPQSGGPGIQYVWDSWSDAGAISHTIDATVDTTITANFRTQYYLTMNAGTGGTVNPPSGWFDKEQRVQISAQPTAAYTFAGWVGVGNGSYTGPGNPDSVTMYAPITETASFTLFPVNVSVQTEPSGRSITVDGTVFTSPQNFIWTSGTNHVIAVDSLPPGDTSVMRYEWRRWSDSSARSHTVSTTIDTVFTAYFDTQYVMAMRADTGGTVTPPTSWYRRGTTVPITANPSTGWKFDAWTGSGSGSYSGPDNPANVLVNGPILESAAFSLKPVSITVRTNPTGYTFVVDGTTYSTPQVFTWDIGSQHTIETDSIRPGIAGVRYIWAGWSDAGSRVHTFIPTKDSVVTATIATQYFVTMLANLGGSVTPASGWFNGGQQLPITAIESDGYAFTRWVGTGVGSYSGGNNPATINVNGPITETASFVLEPIQVTVQASPIGRSFRVNGTQYNTPQTFSFLPGATQSIGVLTSPQTVDSITQYRFDRWSDGGAMSHNIAPTRDTVFTVFFTRQCLLSMAADTGGTFTPPTGWYDTAQTVIISANANVGYSFTGWVGTGEGSYTGPGNPDSVSMFGTIRQRATFSQNPVLVSILSEPRGRAFRVDGQEYVDSQRFVWRKATEHILQASSPQDIGPGSRYVWKGWSNGAPDSQVVMPATDSSFVVTYGKQFLLSTTSQNGGSAVPSNSWQDSGKSVQITAVPDSGYGFSGWTGTGPGSYSGTSNPVTLTMQGEIQQLASFVNLGPIPVLAGPSDGAIDQSIMQNLGWASYPQATSYRLQLATDALFDSLVIDTTVQSDTSILVGPLSIVTTYYWRVIVTVNGSITTLSRARSFTTILPSLAVNTPQRSWATTYTYVIRWTSSDLIGPVNISVSPSGGGAYQQIITNAENVGAAIWTIPAGQTLSTTYRLRVESVSYPSIVAESGTFPVVSGTLTATAPVSTYLYYPADDVKSTDYRLVSMPGILNNVTFNSFVTGTHRIDWRAYLDDGSQDNYLVEQFPASPVVTGKGYWFVQNRPFEYTGTMIMPQLSADATYLIPLQPGWNIIANPFDKPVAWSDVQRENGIPSTSPIKGYDGSFKDESMMIPFRAYYFDNTLNLTQLKLPYPFGPATPPLLRPRPTWSIRLSLNSDINKDEENYIGIADIAASGRDPLDQHKTPLFLDQGFLYFQRPDWDGLYSRFSSDFRPSLGEGQIWPFDVSNPRGSACAINFTGLEAVPENFEIVLVNGYNTIPVDIRRNPQYQFRSVVGKNPFALIVGTPEFVRSEVKKYLPDEYELSQNFPNPFNSSTTISYRLPVAGDVRIEIVSILGQTIAILNEGKKDQGRYAVNWGGVSTSGEPVASGVYFYRLMVDGKPMQSHKLVIAK